MTVVGTASKVTIMVGGWGSAYDYTNKCVNLEFSDNLNSIVSGRMVLDGVIATDSNVASEKDVYFLYGINSGTYKCYKFRIKEIEFKSNGLAAISLDPSMGSTVSSVFKNMVYDTDNIGTTLVVGAEYRGNLTDLLDSDYGIVTDIADLDGTDDGQNFPLIIRITSDHRIDIMRDAVNACGKEWWVEWTGTDGTHPNFDTDEIHVADTRGDVSSTNYTFYLDTISGGTPNAFVGGLIKGKSDLKNYILLEGKSYQNREIYGRSLLNSDKTTLLHNNGLDTYLTADFDPGDTTITVKKTSCFMDETATAYSGNFKIRIDNEFIDVNIASATSLNVVTRNVYSSGDFVGVETKHLSGAEVLNYGETTGAAIGSLSINVDSTTGFPNTGSDFVVIGSEVFNYQNVNSTAFYDVIRSPTVDFLDWKVYAHHIGDQTVRKYIAQNTSEDPSSVYSNGLRSYHKTGMRSFSSAHLDFLAEKIAQNSENEIEKIYLIPVNPHSMFASIDIGDKVVVNSTNLNLGSADYRIVGMNVTYSGGGGLSVKYTLNKLDLRNKAFLIDNNFISELIDLNVRDPVPTSQDVMEKVNQAFNIASTRVKNLLQMDSLGANITGVATGSKVTPDEAGNIYHDTTETHLRFYDGTNWQNLVHSRGDTFTGDIVLDDGSGDSPSIKFINQSNDELEIYIDNSTPASTFSNTQGTMYFDCAGTYVIELGDNAGSSDFRVDDSDGTNWFAIDSDGAATFEGECGGTRLLLGYGEGGNTSGDAYLEFGGDADTGSTGGPTMIRAGSITGFSISFECTVLGSSGTLDVEVRKNGSVVWSSELYINATTIYLDYNTQARGTDSFSAGDQIAMSINFKTFAGTLDDISGLVEIVYD